MESKYKAITEIVLRNIPDAGSYPCPVKGVRLIRTDNPTEFSRCFYNYTCIFVLQGQKQMIFGSAVNTYKKGQYVLSCTDIPAICRVEKATKDEPFVGIVLQFDSDIMTQLLLETKARNTASFNNNYLAVADSDEELTDAFYRLALLIEKPRDDMLTSIIIKEIYYRILIGPLGNQLRLINTRGSNSNQISQAISYLKDNFNEKLNIEDIAQYVNMAPSSFYRNFRKVTKISPLQYQKQLRLYEAQRLMLSGEYNAESASYMVGYESPTQFSREYKKMFGHPPKTDIRQLIAV